jgi:phosphoribosyl 1,2-cyclic phosphodiesterase
LSAAEGNGLKISTRRIISWRVPVQFTILGSGSGGNCAYLETDQARILIDAGFSGRQIRKRLEAIGRSPESLTGILITHEHSDHIQGLSTLTEKLRVPLYCNRLTRDALEFQFERKLDCHVFATGAAFEVGDITVETFSVPHDAQDPVGFLLRTPGGNVGFLTDLGHATKLVLERVKAANVLVVEANHDIKMLQDCPHRPWSLKQRILGRHGHLSNEAAADAVEQVMSADMRHLYLGHLSRECNKPDLAAAVMGRKLQTMGANHVTMTVTSQAQASPTLMLALAIQAQVQGQFQLGSG